MGKADMSRDYYSDLELQPTANLAEIKKQFKKLALLYHPDRNPGRETLVNAKFQTIQSAHEILSDEVERRRYDAGRIRRNSRFPSSAPSGTKGNPWSGATAAAGFPPPPMRTGASGQGASGADKFYKFHNNKGAPTSKQQDPNVKKANADAFERMKKSQPKAQPSGSFAGTYSTQNGHYSGGSPKVPDPRYTPQSGREESNNQKHAPPPKSGRPGYDEWNAGEMHGRQSPRKPGFMPSNPGGDEPPAAYYNGRSTSTRASTARTTKGPDPPPRPSAFEEFRESNETVDGGSRKSQPYATHGGEKTSLFGQSNIHRSKTTRERSTANGYSSEWEPRNQDPATPGSTRDKHRSASPPRTRNGRSKAPEFDANVGSPPKRNHSHMNTSPPTSGTANKAGRVPRSNTRSKPAAISDDSSSDEDSDFPVATDNHPSTKRLPRRKVPAQSETDNSSKSNVRNDQQQSAGNPKGPNAASQPIFPTAYRSQPSAIPPLFTASNAESINTKFDTGKWNGQFRAASFVNPTEFNNGTSRPQAGSRSGRRSPTKSRSGVRTRSASASLHSGNQSPIFEEPQAPSQPVESPVSKPFQPKEWIGSDMFKPSDFAPPTAQGPTRPPFSQRTPSRKGSRARTPQVNKTAGGKAAVVEDDSSDSERELFEQTKVGTNGDGSNSAAQTGVRSPNAMDIDSPYDITRESSGEARNVPVEPLRPEWRAGATNGNTQSSNIDSQPSAGSSKHEPDDEEDFKTNFDDLKNVEPLFQPAQGLNSVNDLKFSLPFQSTASHIIPLQSEVPQLFKIEIPSPPTLPKVPSPMAGTQRMSPSSWQSYLVNFKAYLASYQLYNDRIMNHFSERRRVTSERIQSQGWAWLEFRSDVGVQEHLEAAKVDRLVREKWAEAGRGHEATMEQFQAVRAAMMGETTEE